MTLYRLHPDVVWIARPDGSAGLMHLSANVCVIDSDSAALLRSMLSIGPERAVYDLVARHDLGEADAWEEVKDFITELCEQRLIQPLPHRDSWRERVRECTARAFVPGMLRLVLLVMRSPRGKARGLLWTARLAVAQFGWATTMRMWERIFPQPAADKPASGETLDAIDHAVRYAASRSLITMECKERSLACLALARGNEIRTQLIVGVSQDPIQAHVWVEAGGRIISDDPEHFLSFEPVMRYG